MKIAIAGYKGRLGSELVDVFGCIPLKCDIKSGLEIQEAVSSVRPDVIINCAAKTGVDECETEEGFEEALRVNFRGAMNIRTNFRGHLIQISTDYVFDGHSGAYSEEYDEFNPVNRYGWTKYGAEAALNSVFSEGRTTIVRTTGLYGSRAILPDLAKSIYWKLKDDLSFGASAELFGNQTYIPHLAEALLKLCYGKEYRMRDVIHIASEEVISRYEFALRIARMSGFDESLVYPVKNNEVLFWKANRPTKGGLLVDKAKSYLLPIHSIEEGLTGFLGRAAK